MLKISKVLLLLVLIAASFAGAMEKLWLSCGQIQEGWDNFLDCYIYQGAKKPTAIDERYLMTEYGSWNELVKGYGSVREGNQALSNRLNLGSKIVFDGYDSKTMSCAGTYNSIELGNTLFDGHGKSVVGFCQKGETSSFFTSSYQDIIKNVIFEDAYIEVEPKDNPVVFPRRAAVVVDSLKGFGTVLNVKVKNSKVHIVASKVVETAYEIGSVVGYAENVYFDSIKVESVSITGVDNSDDLKNRYSVGGVVGSFFAKNTSYESRILNSDVVVRIDLPFRSNVNAGGVAGYVDANNGETRISRNILRPSLEINAKNADSLSLISLTATNMRFAAVGGVVGYVNADASGTITGTFNSVYGLISAAATNFDNDGDLDSSSGVGGVIGFLNAQYNGRENTIQGNSSIGSIVAPALETGSKERPVGYIAGFIFSYGNNTKTMGNFHYGEKDKDVKWAVGWYGNDGSNYAADYTTYWDGYGHNYRNSIYDGKNALLKEDGTELLTSGIVAGNMYNPVIPLEVMKSRPFTYELNSYSSDGDLFWENDTANNGLPYLTDKRTVYRVMISTINYYDGESHSNEVADGFTHLTPFFDNSDSSQKFMTFTNRDGRIPEDFLNAYNEDVKERYGLTYESSGEAGTIKKGAVLNSFKVYAPNPNGKEGEHVYYVQISKRYNVVYEGLPDSDSLIYSPKKMSSVDRYDPTNLVPRVYDKANDNKAYIPVSAYLSCLDMSDGINKGDHGTLYEDRWNLNDIFDNLYFDDSDCQESPVLNLVYDEEDVDTRKTISVETNEKKLLVRTALYGYDSKGKVVAVSDTIGEQYNEIERPIASQMEFFLDALGYSVDTFAVDLWVCWEREMYKMCKEGTLECPHLTTTSNYLSGVDSMVNLLSQYEAVRWTVILDSNKRVILDSALVALTYSNMYFGDAAIIVEPTPMAKPIQYNVTFDLPNGESFYTENPSVTYNRTEVFDAENKNTIFPQILYSNDACVVGWKSADMDTINDLSMKKYGFNDYNVYVFGNFLNPAPAMNKLTPVLMPAEMCADEALLSGEWGDFRDNHYKPDYQRVVAKGIVGASVRIEESHVKQPELNAVVHTFGKSKSMLLYPNVGEMARVIRFESKAGFEGSDSISFYYDLSRKPQNVLPVVSSSQNLHPVFAPPATGFMKFADGDTLPENLAFSVLEGEFTMVDTTALAFVDTLVETAGSTVRVKVSTTKFAAGRDAELLITVMDNLGNLIDTTRKLVHETPYVLDTTYFVQPGSYVVLGLMSDALDSTASFAAIANVAADIPVAKDVWQMVSLNPVDMSAVGKDDDQIFYRWDDEAEVGEFWHYLRFLPGDDVESAGGYWYSSLEGRPLKFSDSYKDSVYDIEWNLVNGYSGWNMVGNPHNWNVKVPDDLEIVMWDPATGDYAPNRGYLKPFEAAWVRVEKNRKVSVNGDPYFVPDSLADAAAAKKRALVKTKNAENWTIRAILADNKGKMDSWNILGMGDAQEGFEPPAGMGDIVSFAVKDGKKYLAKSVKAAPASSADSAALEWDVLLSASSDRKGKLYFEGLEGIEAYGYHLYVTVDGRTSELTAGDTLAVALKAASTTAKVRVTKEKLYFRTAVEGLRMVQAGNKLNVGFTATENLDGSRMVVDILDMDGKVVSTYSARAASGSNAVSLDAPKSGLYMLRVRVASQQAAGKILVK